MQDSVQFIKGVGPKRARLLARLGLHTVLDCLLFLPHRYEDRSRVKTIGQLVPGEQVTFRGTVLNAGTFRLGRRRKVYEVIVQDATGTIRARWYQFNEKYMNEKFKVGATLIVSGKPTFNRYSGAGLEIIHPDIEMISEHETDVSEIGQILPVYHITEGLHQKSMRAIMKNVVDIYTPLLEEFIPGDILRRHKLPVRSAAIQQCHFPPKDTPIDRLARFRTPAQLRMIFEEFFLLQLGLAYQRRRAGEIEKGLPFKTRGDTIRRFVKLMQFELTGAQKRVLGEIMDDLERSRPMHRLIHGDVGSGKTIVALISLLTAVDNGYQGAFMAPTELLAEQHYLNIKPYCDALGVSLDLVTSAAAPKEKKEIRERIASGKTRLAVGTHALIQKDVEFHNLGLVVIDEQHRFGVLQREALGRKGPCPHVLVMTATPIPRSLALTLYGDMDVSVLDEMPPGRRAIRTRLFPEKKRDEAYEFLRKHIAGNRQAYVVCPLIEGTETQELKTAMDVHEDLRQRFPDVSVGLVHGRLNREERQRIMSDFKEGRIRILVATTVIEVGIDVPNASLMLIEHAERFGLAQLHQLRGRVGRGEHDSYCLLVAYPPITDDAKARLDAMLKSRDGFFIAEQDLRIRGPGDFMGTRQSGLPALRFADLVRDLKVIETARKEAFTLIDRDPSLSHPDHEALRQALQDYFGDRLDLIDVL